MALLGRLSNAIVRNVNWTAPQLQKCRHLESQRWYLDIQSADTRMTLAILIRTLVLECAGTWWYTWASQINQHDAFLKKKNPLVQLWNAHFEEKLANSHFSCHYCGKHLRRTSSFTAARPVVWMLRLHRI